jgi:hypothetical protein
MPHSRDGGGVLGRCPISRIGRRPRWRPLPRRHLLHRRRRRRRRHFIMTSHTSFSSLSHTFIYTVCAQILRRQVNTLAPTNTSSAVHQATLGTHTAKRQEYYGRTALLDGCFLCAFFLPMITSETAKCATGQDFARERSHTDQIRSYFILA